MFCRRTGSRQNATFRGIDGLSSRIIVLSYHHLMVENLIADDLKAAPTCTSPLYCPGISSLNRDESTTVWFSTRLNYTLRRAPLKRYLTAPDRRISLMRSVSHHHDHSSGHRDVLADDLGAEVIRMAQFASPTGFGWSHVRPIGRRYLRQITGQTTGVYQELAI